MGGTESRDTVDDTPSMQQWITAAVQGVVSSSNPSSKMPCTPTCMITVPDKTIDEATNKGHMSSNQRDAVKNVKPGSPSKRYYQAQSKQTLGEEYNRVNVSIWVADSVHKDWIPHLKNAVEQINIAAPGLNLEFVGDRNAAKIKIHSVRDDKRKPDAKENEAYTRGNIVHYDVAEIYLGKDWSNDGKKQTSLHEIFHALGFMHEQSRKDASDGVTVDPDVPDEWRGQVEPEPDYSGMTRFDPFSVMLYPVGKGQYLERNPNDPIWKLVEEGHYNTELSELDKVGLNFLYRPCKSPGYNPKRSAVTGMYYCGRRVMKHHNYPAGDMTDGCCGPDNWANCPACRTLENSAIENFQAQDKWQGWSGLVYCGKWFGVKEPGHDGYCGPDNGLPCRECGRILWDQYDQDHHLHMLAL